MKIANGRTHFYQWDLNQHLELSFPCAVVYFENGTQSESLGCEVKEVNGKLLCDVPNDLLQTAAQLHAYAWDAEKTYVIAHMVYVVEQRERPADYVYTQTEVWTAEKAVAEALEKAKASGEFKGDPGYTPIRGEDYWTTEDQKAIMDKCCPAFSASGAIVTCEPVEGYPLGVEWKTKNLLNLSGRKKVSEANDNTTKRAFDGNKAFIGITTNNHQYYYLLDSYTLTETGMTFNSKSNAYGIGYDFPVEEGVTYTVSADINHADAYCGLAFYQEDGTFIYHADRPSGKTYSAKAPANAKWAIVSVITRDTAVNQEIVVTNMMVEASTTATAYEPYAETATVTRCGKNLLNLSGRKTVSHATESLETAFDGNQVFLGYAQNSKCYNRMLSSYTLTETGMTFVSTSNAYGIGYDFPVKAGVTYTVSANRSGFNSRFGLTFYQEDGTMITWNSRESGPLTHKAPDNAKWAIASVVAVGSPEGQEVVVTDMMVEASSTATSYEPYQGNEFAVGEPIPALSGVNTIYADTGLVTVTGRADPTAIINNLEDRLAALEAALVNT